QHLDFLAAAARANLVWTDTPSAVLRYRHARTSCHASVAEARIAFDASDPECARFATPISVVVATRADLPGLRAVQQGRPVSVLRLRAGEFSVTADPTRGDVMLSGCNAPGPSVDERAPVPPRPKAAASVCAFERVPSRSGLWT